MQFIQNYKAAIISHEKSDDNFSEANSSILMTESECPDYAELIIAEGVQRKGEPVTGKRYLWFNIFMIIFLGIWVIVYDFQVVVLKDKRLDLIEEKHNKTLVKN